MPFSASEINEREAQHRSSTKLMQINFVSRHRWSITHCMRDKKVHGSTPASPFQARGFAGRYRREERIERLTYKCAWKSSPLQPTQDTIRLFLCGDVMTERGIDQIMADPCNPARMQTTLGGVFVAYCGNGRLGRAFLYVPISSACAKTCPAIALSSWDFVGRRRSGRTVSTAYSL